MNLSHNFGRVTSGGRFIPVVDGLRCIAIVSVVLYHLEDYITHKGVAWNSQSAVETATHRLLHAGHVGVPLFFALSGFILALPFFESAFGVSAGRATDLQRYYLRRVTRLEPPYLINLAIAGLMLAVVNGVPWGELLPHFAASAFYVHNQVYGDVSTINPVAWSLEIEVQFYLIAPWLARGLIALSPITRRTVLVASMAALMAAKAGYGRYPPHVALSLVGTIDHFLAGILLADLYVALWRSNPVRSAGWDLVSVLVWPAIFAVPRSPLLVSSLPLLTMLAYTAAFRGRVTHRLLTWTPAVLVGGMCYSIYLYHFFVISAVGRFTLPLTSTGGYLQSVALQVLLIVPVVIVSCAVLFRLFERPFMSWRPGRSASPRASETGPLAAATGFASTDVSFAAGAAGIESHEGGP